MQTCPPGLYALASRAAWECIRVQYFGIRFAMILITYDHIFWWRMACCRPCSKTGSNHAGSMCQPSMFIHNPPGQSQTPPEDLSCERCFVHHQCSSPHVKLAWMLLWTLASHFCIGEVPCAPCHHMTQDFVVAWCQSQHNHDQAM